MPSSGSDVPDDAFTDSNCDGIDGDAAHSIFVAPTGSDAANGSSTAPVKTLAKAITLATATGWPVLVANGTYAENIVVTKPVALYGGYDSQNAWHREDDRATVSPAAGIPLSVQNVAGHVVIDRLALHAPDAKGASASSIAALVSLSTDVAIHHALLEARSGADGATPAPPAAPPAPAPAEDGQSLAAVHCGQSWTTGGDCAVVARGGTGGQGACNQGGPGGAGGNQPMLVGPVSGIPGVGNEDVSGKGRDGSAGVDGASATTGYGTLTATGYVANNSGMAGDVGASGGGGKGGDGGGSFYWDDTRTSWVVGGAGGGGGAGGCPGAGSQGGGGGGASIGLAAYHSTVTVTVSEIDTGSGGAGGASVPGGMGAPGAPGGKGGLSTLDSLGHQYAAGDGAPGGAGGQGGAGGAGAGGPSIGVFSVGPAPAIDQGTIFSIGIGGQGGSGANGTDGASGEATQIHAEAAPSGADAGSDGG